MSDCARASAHVQMKKKNKKKTFWRQNRHQLAYLLLYSVTFQMTRSRASLSLFSSIIYSAVSAFVLLLFGLLVVIYYAHGIFLLFVLVFATALPSVSNSRFFVSVFFSDEKDGAKKSGSTENGKRTQADRLMCHVPINIVPAPCLTSSNYLVFMFIMFGTCNTIYNKFHGNILLFTICEIFSFT